MIIELRRYRCAAGRREEWIDAFQEVVAPFMASKGMVVLGSFRDQQDADVHVWLRRFDDEAHRERLREAVYQSQQWKDEIWPGVKDLLLADAIEVTQLAPTAGSPLR